MVRSATADALRCQPLSLLSSPRSLYCSQVNIGLRVLTRPMPSKLPEIYRTLGSDYAERVLPSIIQETLKSVIAQYNASQLLTMREVRHLCGCFPSLEAGGGWLVRHLYHCLAAGLPCL